MSVGNIDFEQAYRSLTGSLRKMKDDQSDQGELLDRHEEAVNEVLVWTAKVRELEDEIEDFKVERFVASRTLDPSSSIAACDRNAKIDLHTLQEGQQLLADLRNARSSKDRAEATVRHIEKILSVRVASQTYWGAHVKAIGDVVSAVRPPQVVTPSGSRRRLPF